MNITGRTNIYSVNLAKGLFYWEIEVDLPYRKKKIEYHMYTRMIQSTGNLASLWRHQMETVSALLAICEGNPPVTGGFLSQRASNTGFDDSFDVSLNKRLSKQTSRQWKETPGYSFWRHCNAWFALWDSHYTFGLALRIRRLLPRRRYARNTFWLTSWLEVVVFWPRLPILVQFVPTVSINNKPTLGQIMARQTSDNPLSEPNMV